MLDGCHGAKTDHTPWAPGQHQPIGAQHGGCLTNQGAAQGPAAAPGRICHSGHRGLTPRIVTRKLFVTCNLPIRGLSWVTNKRTAHGQ